ncbi:hypothetical protein T4E_7650 [Trichinella pseudospiralis]|uniref:Uncharacterized protein n=1 Tax=Trichinella pseudospiralis TaxID=6337 RepID=A0A0V0XDA8_TRIPS|nr:hypothetical protein T4E_7650 [Trichinella pseudospiralis]
MPSAPDTRLKASGSMPTDSGQEELTHLRQHPFTQIRLKGCTTTTPSRTQVLIVTKTANKQRHATAQPRFNYELFNCSNFNIRFWSWSYRGCWHQTCPPIGPR